MSTEQFKRTAEAGRAGGQPGSRGASRRDVGNDFEFERKERANEGEGCGIQERRQV
jgi:hypothetical protein